MSYTERDTATGPVSEEELTFRLSQVMEFLAAKGRTTQCPLCPHNGGWIFHTADGSAEDDPNVLIFKFHNSFEEGTFTPVALMECPQCGFMPSVSLFGVMHYFKEKKNG